MDFGRRNSVGLVGAMALAGCWVADAGAAGPTDRRVVLVELYTSQGCDMCPEAERQLGVLAEGEARVAAVAFRVDYFNTPWKDPFPDPLYSRRQAAYNATYTKPKNAEYGFYYTPMLMVNGTQSVNGRDLDAARGAVRLALAKPPQVTIESDLMLKNEGKSGDLSVTLSTRSAELAGRDLLVCAVLRDDKLVTKVPSGENAGKSLTSRFPARQTEHQFTRLTTVGPTTLKFSLTAEGERPFRSPAVLVFVQDRAGGEVYQAVVTPWGKSERPAGASR